MPAFVAPMLAELHTRAPVGPEWAFEFKWDGVRALARWDGWRLTLLGRNRTDFTPRYPELDSLDEVLGDRNAILDGEIVALDDQGRPNFERLQRRMHVTDPRRALALSRTTPVLYLAFDVLWLDGANVMGLPYLDRRELLVSLDLDRGPWRAPEHHLGHGAAMLRTAAGLGLEGIVAKRTDSTYQPGKRIEAWRKLRIDRRQEFVIGGWTPGKGARRGDLGALLVGFYEGEKLRYAGKVGTGFDRATLRQLRSLLKPIARGARPFTDDPKQREAKWVEPVHVCEVKFTEWTSAGQLRHPSYQGLRADKDPEDVVRETQ